MALPVITAVNQTGSIVFLNRLGLSVPASGSLVLTDYAFVDEIRQDESLHAAIAAGVPTILLDFGSGVTNQGESLNFFNVVSMEVRAPVRILADANIGALTGLPGTIDGVLVAVDDRILLTAQSTASENGIWVVKARAWVRPEDFGNDEAASNALVAVDQGTTYGDQVWQCTSDRGSDIIGTSSLTWSQTSGGGGGAVDLQTAYDNGNTIVTAGSTDIDFTLTSGDFVVNDGSILFGNTTPLTTFTVDSGTMSLDSTDTTNLTMTANDAGDKILTISATNAGAGDGLISISSDGETDIDAGGDLSLNSSAGAINVGNDANTGAINVGTGAAARTITVGNATGATAVDVNTGTGGFDLNSLGTIEMGGVGNSNLTIDSGNLLLSTTTSGNVNVTSVQAVNVSSGTSTDIQAASDVTIDSSGGSLNMGTDTDDGDINIGTGTTAGRVITIGNNTGTTSVAVETGTGNFLVDAPTTTLTGNLVVQGTTSTVQSEIVNISDSFLYLNDGYETTGSPLAGGIVVNVNPLTTNDTVAAGGFTAGVASTSNPTVTTTGSATFAAGDFIQIAGAADQTNDGLYEVLSHVGTTLTVAGVGVTGPTFGFVQNDFTTDATASGTIRKIEIGSFHVSTSGTPQFGYDSSSTTFTFNDITTGATTLTLQTAYVGGNTITTSAGEGAVIVAGTETLQITATGGLDVDTVADFDVTTFDVQMTGSNGFSIDGTDTSNLTTSSGDLTVEATTGALLLEGGEGVEVTSSGGDIAIAADVNSGNVDVGTGASARQITVGNTTGTTGININSGSEKVEIDGVTYYGNSAGAPTATLSGFQDGDKYFDTTLDMEMRYDAGRSKWLSVEAMYIQFGRNGNTNVNQYYRAINGRVMSATLGYTMPHDGTIVALGYTRTDSDAATFDVVEGGTSRATLASSATSGKSNTLNGDFSEDGILAMRNTGANVTSNVIGWVKVKWRS